MTEKNKSLFDHVLAANDYSQAANIVERRLREFSDDDLLLISRFIETRAVDNAPYEQKQLHQGDVAAVLARSWNEFTKHQPGLAKTSLPLSVTETNAGVTEVDRSMYDLFLAIGNLSTKVDNTAPNRSIRGVRDYLKEKLKK